ncbi:MAG: amidohydrolase family protein [Firmicutes bacterium]|nr:amidohydrolase family protein [Bacillota bacterium]
MAFGFFKKKEEHADKLFYNAYVYTMNEDIDWPDDAPEEEEGQLHWVNAVAVKDGRILAVGDYGEMESLIDDDTEKIDLKGKFLVPGFIDIHHSPVMRLEEKLRGPLDGDDVMDEENAHEELDLEVEKENFDPIFGTTEVIVETPEEEEPPEEEKLEEEYAEELDGELDEEEPAYVMPTDEFLQAFREELEALGDHGITSVLNIKTPNELELEFEDQLIELYSEGTPCPRFYGSLYVNLPVFPQAVRSVLLQRRTKCTELDGMVVNEVLYLSVDGNAAKHLDRHSLADIMVEAADRGFTYYIEAATKHDLIEVYEAVDELRNKGHKNIVIVACDLELDGETMSRFSSSQTVLKTWEPVITGRSFFEGHMDDIGDAMDHMTIEAARILGLDEELGTVEKGKRADFAIFDEDPYTLTPAELSKAYCDMTVVNGEIVHDVDRENEDFLMDMMLHSR